MSVAADCAFAAGFVSAAGCSAEATCAKRFGKTIVSALAIKKPSTSANLKWLCKQIGCICDDGYLYVSLEVIVLMCWDFQIDVRGQYSYGTRAGSMPKKHGKKGMLGNDWSITARISVCTRSRK